MTDIRLKRAYENPADTDGSRVLVDALWPRGVSRDDLDLDIWLKDIAPGTGLRRWFGHDPDRWEEFRRRYRESLDADSKAARALISRAEHGRLTLVYAAKDETHNNAVVLKEWLEELLGGS